MNPAPRATKYFRYDRSQFLLTIMVPPNTLAAAAVVPNSRLRRTGCMRVGMIAESHQPSAIRSNPALSVREERSLWAREGFT
jgi:hypothetical protein